MKTKSRKKPVQAIPKVSIPTSPLFDSTAQKQMEWERLFAHLPWQATVHAKLFRYLPSDTWEPRGSRPSMSLEEVRHIDGLVPYQGKWIIEIAPGNRSANDDSAYRKFRYDRGGPEMPAGWSLRPSHVDEEQKPSRDVLRIDRPGEKAGYETITFAYPRTPDRPWPPGTEIPKVRSYVAETVDEFHVHVEMPYKPVRKPARVGLTIQEIGAFGGIDPHRRAIQPLPMSPAAARELGKLLIEAAVIAEDMDANPYPPPEDASPPLRG